MIKRVVMAATTALCGSVVVGIQAAGASVLACGSVVTHSIVLTADVGPCTGDGIVVGADGIVVDLNGHTVSGAPSVGRVGVLVENRHRVTVRNGRVTRFEAGIALVGGGSHRVEGMTATGNVSPLAQTSFGSGIAARNSSGNAIVGNRATGNSPWGGITLLGASSHNLIEGNDASHNVGLLGGFSSEADGIGFQLSGGASPTFNVVRGNTTIGNGDDGIGLGFGSNDNLIVGNEVSRNGFVYHPDAAEGSAHGIRIGIRAFRNRVEHNRSTYNARDGILIEGSIFTDLRNVVVGNVALFNGQDPAGWLAYDLDDQNRRCGTNIWRNNVYRVKVLPGGADCIN